MLSLRKIVAHSASEMDRLEPLWNELLGRREHTLFQFFSWNRLAAEAFRDRMTPHVVCVMSSNGTAIIPAAIHHATQRLELLGGTLFDYRDILHAGDVEVLQAAWQELAALEKPLRVIGVRDRDGWQGIPLKAFAKAPQVDHELIDSDGFRRAHPRLGRQLRRMHHQGAVLRQFAGKHSEQVRRLYERKAEFSPPASENLFLDERRRHFMIAAAAIDESCCEIFTLEDRHGDLIAGLLSFRDRRVRRCYTIYFHPAWARYSPGSALLYEVTARSLAEGLSCDYMTGEYPYKLRLANATRELYRVDLSARELADAVWRQRTARAA